MSPEQCDGAELTSAADVYSLGVILYEMLTGTVPFSGSSPLAIAMKHTGEVPRNPSDFVSTIPTALEQVVLHTLEKNPQDRPGNAAEFRAELLSTAQRLGLENAAIASGPNLEALRSVGTESPSGRLVIDISRLRENQGAANSDLNEMTVVSAARAVDLAGADGSDVRVGHRSFPKVSVPLIGYRSKKQVIAVAAIIAAMLLTGAGLAVRSRNAGSEPNAIAGPSPSPTVAPSPSPSPSPVATPKPTRKPPAQKKPEGNSFFNKSKRALKKLNPF
jgi:serine/threonine protein kinase